MVYHEVATAACAIGLLTEPPALSELILVMTSPAAQTLTLSPYVVANLTVCLAIATILAVELPTVELLTPLHVVVLLWEPLSPTEPSLVTRSPPACARSAAKKAMKAWRRQQSCEARESW